MSTDHSNGAGAMTPSHEALHATLDRVRTRSLLVGAVALLVCVAAAWRAPDRFYQAYLPAYLLWASIALGSLALLMLHHLTGGAWGFVIRRVLESSSQTIPALLLLFLPVLLGMRRLYVWTAPEELAAEPILQAKAAYLNIPFFLARAALYFGVWIWLSARLNRWSARQDRGEAPLAPIQRLSALGLLLYGLTATFAAVDWVMSLEPDWYSTIYGMLFMVGHALAALAFAVPVLRVIARARPLAALVSGDHFQDLGNLLLGFVLLWAYLSFAQYLIIWSGNLVEEIPWYLRRTRGGWGWIPAGLIAFHFALPFALLLMRTLKRRAEALVAVAGLLLAVRAVDLFWLVRPAFADAVQLHWLDLLTPVAIGGIWLGLFLQRLTARPLVPLHDPRFPIPDELVREA